MRAGKGCCRMATHRLEAIFLDFDGVLIDSVPIKAEVFAGLVKEVDPDGVEPAMEYFMRNGGVARKRKFHHVWTEILGRPADESELVHVSQEFGRRVFERCCSVPFITGAREFLEAFADLVPLHVISGTPEQELRDIVERRGMTRYFRGVHGSPATKVEIGNSLLEREGYARGGVWFVGDATTDRDAARTLDVGFVGVDGPHLRPYLDGSEILIRDLSELAGVLPPW